MKKLFKWIVIILISVTYLMFVLKSIRTLPLNSDSTGMLLYAEDILSGNIFLSGWYLTGLTFITTDLPFFIIGVAIFGVSLKAFHTAVFLMYIVLLLTALPLVFYGVKNKWISAIFLFIIGLFPTGYALSNTFVHTGVFALMFLSCFILYSYDKSPKVFKLILLGLTTALSVAGDHMGLILITLPITALAVFKVFKKNIPTVISVISGTVAGFGIELLFLKLGGAVLNNLSRTSFTEPELFQYNVQSYIEYFLKLINGFFFGKEFMSLETGVYLLKIIMAGLAAYAVFRCFKKALKKENPDIPTLMLSVGFVIVSLLLLIGNFSIDITAGRYISYLPLFLAIVLSRADFKYTAKSKVVLSLICVFLIVMQLGGIGNISPYNRYSELSDFLYSQNLTKGYASFWDSHVLTGYSEGKVRVVPVYNTENGIAPRLWFSKASDYTTKNNTFFILKTEPLDEQEKIYNDSGIHNVFLGSGKTHGRTYELPYTFDAITETFGTPDAIKVFKNYKMLIYENLAKIQK